MIDLNYSLKINTIAISKCKFRPKPLIILIYVQWTAPTIEQKGETDIKKERKKKKNSSLTPIASLVFRIRETELLTNYSNSRSIRHV